MGEAAIRRAIDNAAHPLQLVYISTNAERVAASVDSMVRHYEADRAVILCPPACRPSMREVLARYRLAGTILDDDDLLGAMSAEHRHQQRNFALRRALYAREEVEPVFLGLDDDCILLRRLPADYFIRAGRLVARYSHTSLSGWKCDGLREPNSFDEGQWNTGAFLRQKGYGEFGFAAHCAQVIEKSSVCSAFSRTPENPSAAFDEWSVYFNQALHEWPNCFSAEPTTTLFWPENHAAWLPDFFAAQAWFENRYDHVYREGGFAARDGLTPDSDWREKHAHCRAGYVAQRKQARMNALSSGGQEHFHAANGLETDAGQFFGLQGRVAKFTFRCDQGRSLRVQYLVSRDGRPVAESISPPQTVDSRRDLAVRMPARPGEYLLTVGPVEKGAWEPVTRILYVFAYPPGGNG